MVASITLLLLIIIHFASVQASTPQWSFIVIADWHGVESFARDDTPEQFYLQRKWQLNRIKSLFEGDFVALVGDMVEVYDASVNSFTTIKKIFNEVGYDKILYALGDHEIGDNGWQPKSDHTNSLGQYHKGFVESLYLDPTSGEYIYKNLKLGNTHITPYGTPFEYTSFAHVHKNILFVTMDVFKQVSSSLFQKTSGGIGGNGVVTADVDGDHLKWLEDILREGSNNPSIKHIFVQGHVPVITPVQRSASSSMTFDRQEESNFWKLLVSYGVDIYFAGEVHANTVLKDKNSDLLQVSTRANDLEGLLDVIVTDDQIELRAYRDENVDRVNKKSYTQAGVLTVDKTSEITKISSDGILHIVDLTKPILYFDFEEIMLISESWIQGLKSKTKQYLDKVEMQGNILRNIVPNKGEFGQNYNAPVGGVQIRDEGIGGIYSGFFDGTMSQMGIYSLGPFVAGTIISVSMWIKTTATKEMLLLHYDRPWKADASGLENRNIFSMTLKDGSPRIYVSKAATLLSQHSEAINDNGWHQIAAVMPYKSCKLSEVLLFIDGKKVSTSVTKDTPLHFENFGHLSVGGVGFAGTDVRNLFPSWKPFVGYIDEVYLWQRRVYARQFRTAPMRRFKRRKNSKCTPIGRVVTIDQVPKVRKCRRKCKRTVNCVGFKTSSVEGSEDLQCTLFLSHAPHVNKDRDTTDKCFLLSSL
ncbi:hypothetical protein CTEN210_14294 [Chaetoceros tenuissimus]|uniref:Laminin G domain-containing protein n=1 Tax=Chaetoceros tenuissimus TaxID=426638 RepID=A0AAD3D4X0_9STRA|nr:hypothetical protein CTEN210_14294 [Chaetoceros tenuissimus]